MTIGRSLATSRPFRSEAIEWWRPLAPVSPASAERGARVFWSGGAIVAAVIASVLAWGSRERRPRSGPARSPAAHHVSRTRDPAGAVSRWNAGGVRLARLRWRQLGYLREGSIRRDPHPTHRRSRRSTSPRPGRRTERESRSSGIPTMGECRILEVPSGGGPERALGSCGKSQNPDLAWSPDGRFLAFSDRESDSESFGIYLLEVESGEKRKLVSPGRPALGRQRPGVLPRRPLRRVHAQREHEHAGRLSHPGRRRRAGTTDVRRPRGAGRVVHTGRQGARRLVGAQRRARALEDTSFEERRRCGWSSPAGRRGRPRREAAASSSSKSAGATRTSTRSPLGSVDAAPSPLLASTHDDREPALSPDCEPNRLHLEPVGIARGLGERRVGTGRAETDELRRPSGGSSVLVSRRPHDRVRCAARGARRPLLDLDRRRRAEPIVASSPANELAPVVRARRSRPSSSAPTDRGRGKSGARPERKPSPAGYVARFAPDGASLYFTKFDSPGLYRRDMNSGEEMKVAGTESLADSFAWTFAEGGLLFLGFESGEVRLFRLDLDVEHSQSRRRGRCGSLRRTRVRFRATSSAPHARGAERERSPAQRPAVASANRLPRPRSRSDARGSAACRFPRLRAAGG